jgi:3-isopropylmalate dehydrogenase
VASPVATVMAVQMMLDYLGEARAAQRIEDAVTGLIRSRRIPSLGSDSGVSTSAVGDLVLEELERAAVRA